jgi:hypothetical protein
VNRPELLDLVERIATDPELRGQNIRTFQEYVLHADPMPGFDEPESEILADLAYDLDFYVANPEWRREDAAYYGEERLFREVREALVKLGKETV